MKIGIVTQPLLGNYGGILQNYALQQVLRQLGHDPITLDFQWGYSGVYYMWGAFKKLGAYVLGKSKSPFLKYAPKRNNPEIVDFVNEHISTTHSFWGKYNPSLIKKYKLEALIVGSDQVWRPRYNPRLADSYLKFAWKCEMPKLAYAASFGTAEWEYTPKQAALGTNMLKQFNAVSVREKSGVCLASKLGADATVCLDPTLLLGREGFDKILNIPTSSVEYVGSYVLDRNPELQNMIRKMQSQLHIDEHISTKENTPGFGPIQWIQNIRDSRFFITDSFHGTVFCLLYHVPFITLVNDGRGADRFFSLLEPLGLAKRLLTSADVTQALQIAKTPIDWNDIDGKLESMRAHSLNFLTSHLH